MSMRDEQCSACTPIGQRDKNCPLREVPNDMRGDNNGTD